MAYHYQQGQNQGSYDHQQAYRQNGHYNQDTPMLHDQMQNMDLNGQAYQQQYQHQQQPPTLKSKKPARRAYHTDDVPSQPVPSQQQASFQGQQNQSQFNAQQQQPFQNGQPQYFNPTQQQQGTNGHPNTFQQPQQPAYVPPDQIDPRLSGQTRGNIAQPPHDAGARMNGPRSKIDPDAIPSPVYVRYQDQARIDGNDGGLFYTCARDLVPGSLTDYVAVDQGNCSPRFLRMTTYTLPSSDDLAIAGQFPLALVTQPFAQVRPGEMPIQVADFSQEQYADGQHQNANAQPGSSTGGQGPPRCSHCKGYINPWFTFLDGGSKYKCNLCSGISDVPSEYYSHLDMQGRRLDIEQRPELMYGSVDFLVPSAYWVQPTPEEIAANTPVASTSKRSHDTAPTSAGLTSPTNNPNLPSTPTPLLSYVTSSQTATKARKAELSRPPEPIKYVFAIDVSWAAGRSGMLRQVTQALKAALYGSEEEGGDPSLEERPNKGTLPQGAKIAIVTFDRTIHFYHLKANLEQPQMMVVPDLDDMFCPLHEGLLVDPHESRTVVENLLDNLDGMFRETSLTEASLGGAVKAGLMLLKRIGGQLNIFQTTLPTLGPGTLKMREDNKLYGTDKERTLFTAQDPFYRQIGEECADAGIGINLFVTPIQYVDIASIGILSGITGGEIFFHPRFDPVREGRKYRSALQGVLSRETGYSVTMRIRCSDGLRIADHIGNFFQRNPTDLEFGNIDADKAITAIIKHDAKLTERAEAFFQVAILYTSASGQRRVRCHNIAVAVSTKLGDVFRTADMDTTIAVVAKEAMTQTLSKTLLEVREQLTERCVKTLLAYRKHCAASVAAGQLILPECYKLFPVYALALSKQKAIKGGQVVSDVRTYFMRLIKSMSVAACAEFFYPRLFPLHVLQPDDCARTPEGRFIMPHTIRLSYERMEAHGCYLLENGETAILWLGGAVSPQLLQDLYGVDDLRELNTHMTAFPKLPTHLSEQVRALVEELESRQRHRKLQITIARQGMDGTEMEFANMLIEDANNDSLGYADYLSLVHKQIQQTVVNNAKEAEAEQSALWRGVW